MQNNIFKERKSTPLADKEHVESFFVDETEKMNC